MFEHMTLYDQFMQCQEISGSFSSFSMAKNLWALKAYGLCNIDNVRVVCYTTLHSVQ